MPRAAVLVTRLQRAPAYKPDRNADQEAVVTTTLDEVAALARGLHDTDRISADLEDVRARLARSFAARTPRAPLRPAPTIGPDGRAPVEPR
jgi:hypothetical protein